MAEAGLRGAAVSPEAMACSAGSGSSTVRPSAQPETAYTTTGASVRTDTVQAARCGAPKSAATVPFAAYGSGIRSVRRSRPSRSNRRASAVIAAASALVNSRPTVVTWLCVASV